MKIAVAAPIRDRAWILPDWLAHLARAAKRASDDGHEVEFIFLENDSVDETLQMLRNFADLWPTILSKHDYGYAHYKVPFADRAKGEQVNPHNDKCELAELRNMIVETFLQKTTAQYLVMWDSDVLMPRETLSSDPRSLVSVMQCCPQIGSLCADVQHPHCAGKFHNYMIEVAPGRYNHIDRSVCIPRERMVSQFIVGPRGRLRWPMKHLPAVHWDDTEPLFVARVETTGGGGAAITQRSVFEEEDARYGAHPQGEDIPFCARARKRWFIMAMYSGIRGLHVPRDLHSGPIDLEDPYGTWIEDWIAHNTHKAFVKLTA